MTGRVAHRQEQAIRRLRLRVKGVVQGVGFRPFAYALAHEMGLSGFVLNDNAGVLIEVEGQGAECFAEALRLRSPPLARVDSVAVEDVEPTGALEFGIRESVAGKTVTRIGADAATCNACLDELFDPASRFFQYPFVNCTHCGPRFTITKALPYDRVQTSMASFVMCEDCRKDYENPLNRRFHAEPVACPACGPKLSHSITEIAEAVQAGRIVALKGIGGFHLVCDARNEHAIKTLRLRKARDEKPFAVMVRDVDAARRFAVLGNSEGALLQSPAHPVVIAQSRGVLPEALAPGLDRIGILLAYAPLHHLLLDILEEDGVVPVLVATSANPGGEPLVASNEDAQVRLGSIADLIVTHDRDIVVRADDSVMQIVNGAPAFLRRARGFVPEPVDLGSDGPSVIGLGSDLKNTVCVTRGREAFLSQHIGGLDNAETIRFQAETARHLCSILDVNPEMAACDLHPDFRSVRLAEGLGLPLVRVQHHVAHIAAVAAEYHIEGAVFGLALDGHGHGADGGAWGGERIVLDGGSWHRTGWLRPLPLAGGDKAAREPWRMAVGALHSAGRSDLTVQLFDDHSQVQRLVAMLERGMRTPLSSSMGRLFDTAAALAGVSLTQSYEGQAAMRLEALVDAPVAMEDGYRITDGVLDFMPVILQLAENGLRGREAANLFHGTLIAGLTAWVSGSSRDLPVALGGGCVMNRVLAEGLSKQLRALGYRVLLPSVAPANDGGIALGQVAFARQQIDHKKLQMEEAETCA
ncbi:carbamoyltransferase HypF [Rhizobium sp. L1K21]|uniref:carbamoyltransferase HypF n=1 Tax=Rhizobium sp. L1K21 TaxID=2954933 RepID=UPI00209398A3|nr:carbamoyltransferase HypF [Rhizobium sp. L1K21]MCO6184618.1 carbamoyltransferase HypF [Rhizobium sp. L1K21]